MGTYNYMLSTKTRKLAVLGEDRSIDVNMTIWGYKDGWGMPHASPNLMRKLGRCETLWAQRAMPQYVMSDGVTDAFDRLDREQWPVYSFEGCDQPHFSEDYLPNYGLFVGYVRTHGKRLALEPWHNMVIPLLKPTWDGTRAIIQEINRKLNAEGSPVRGKVHTSTHRKSKGMTREFFVISAKTPNDLMLAKLAVSDLIAQIKAPDEDVAQAA
jgi:hypothetical protein